MVFFFANLLLQNAGKWPRETAKFGRSRHSRRYRAASGPDSRPCCKPFFFLMFFHAYIKGHGYCSQSICSIINYTIGTLTLSVCSQLNHIRQTPDTDTDEPCGLPSSPIPPCTFPTGLSPLQHRPRPPQPLLLHRPLPGATSSPGKSLTRLPTTSMAPAPLWPATAASALSAC